MRRLIFNGEEERIGAAVHTVNAKLIGPRTA
jgi:hypothetical protein